MNSASTSTTAPAPTIQHHIPSNLPKITATVTTHDPVTRKAIFHTTPDNSALRQWHPPLADGQMAFYTLYQTQQVPVKTDDDLSYHDDFMEKNRMGPPMVVENGTVCRMVDFAPGYTSVEHRALSVDYGVVIEGSIELILDSGEIRHIERGEWTRMLFVSVSAEPTTIDGVALEEDLGGL
ncbi:cupin domain-containing protein [Penicillium malachiteum]|nr:cupin domain-containing protein [Penicillium malachiteum]